MRMQSLGRCLGVLALVQVLGGSALEKDKVDVKVVKYAGLAETVKALRGQVVVVDLWATW